mmetsp:Transcript_15226/g.35287  ORF Transcript_15226/g.35287 Transcript_15226/m.35287 type:complete len:125 (+) Transcript_15226:548-922(+)
MNAGVGVGSAGKTIRAEDVCMIGDDVSADCRGALEAGIGTAILVRTGKYREGDEERWKEDASAAASSPGGGGASEGGDVPGSSIDRRGRRLRAGFDVSERLATGRAAPVRTFDRSIRPAPSGFP